MSGATFNMARCCCGEPEVPSCDKCEPDGGPPLSGNTDQFTAIFSNVIICTLGVCYARDGVRWIKWNTAPAPVFGGAYTLTQIEPGMGLCQWSYDEPITTPGVYTVYTNSGCTNVHRVQTVNRLRIEMEVTTALGPLRIKLGAFYYNLSDNQAFGHIFRKEHNTETPCFGTTILTNNFTTCIHNSGSNSWGSASFSQTGASHTGGTATLDVVVP